MSKRTLGLIIALIAITAVLVTIALSPQKPTVKPQPAIPTPTPVAQTTLTLSPNPLVISSSSASVDVNINTQENEATAVQLELSFDPKMLTVTDITPASYFEKPIVLFKKINNQDGKISYAIAIPPSGTPKKGIGTVAKINIRSLMTAGQQTQITPLPKTMVTASGISPSVLKEALGITIIFEEAPSLMQ